MPIIGGVRTIAFLIPIWLCLQLDSLAEWWLRGKQPPPVIPAAAKPARAGEVTAAHLDVEHDRWHDDGGAPQ
jgi:hypothetical protein